MNNQKYICSILDVINFAPIDDLIEEISMANGVIPTIDSFVKAIQDNDFKHNRAIAYGVSKIQQSIIYAQSIIGIYIEKQQQQHISDILKYLACDIAIYRCFCRQPNELVNDRYFSAIKTLVQLNKLSINQDLPAKSMMASVLESDTNRYFYNNK